MTLDNEDRLASVIGDLAVLSGKCNRDVHRGYAFHYGYYLRELNRIIPV